MILVSKEKLQLLEGIRLSRFVDEMVDYALREHPEAASHMAADALRRAVHMEIVTARNFGVKLRGHTKRYLDLSFSFGFSLGREPWAAKVLSDTDLVPAARLHRLERMAVFRLDER